VLHALILTAIALVILDWTKNLGAEETISLRFEGSIIDRFWLLHFAKGPLSNLLRGSQ
jgi:hypothetical protein